MTTSEAAEKYVKLKNPGAYTGPWFNKATPYIVEPADELNSRTKKGVVFCGPAQSAKTQGLILNWTAYNVKVDPMDMIIYCPSMAAARDFSSRRIDRLHRHSPEIGAMLLKDRDADNKFDKQYSTGLTLTLSWPSAVEFAGRPIGRVAITDYDRLPDDIDGDGGAFDLGSKRTTTFGSYAMTLAESSPSRPVKNPEKWIKQTPHEAPPCDGILGLYNRGDRRRWYWPCPNCRSYFVAGFQNLDWDKLEDNVDASETVRMVCPHCQERIMPDQRYDMQQVGHWLKDGQYFDEAGRIAGRGVRSEIASFWLNGVAAAFQTWASLVRTYLTAEDSYERTGSEEALVKFYNNDLGEPYLPKSLQTQRLPEVIKSRAEDWGSTQERPTVPKHVRFLIAAIDVQLNMWVVQVHGIAPGMPHDIVVIDRFDVRKSKRVDGDGERHWVKPATYLEDWDLLVDQVIKRTYPLQDDPDRSMMIKLTVCDSGGRDGVTSNAYEFYRQMKRSNLAGRVHLVKGDSHPNVPRVKITYPDSSRRDTKAAAQGDVPVMNFNSNMIKDMLANRLDSVVPGKGMVQFPNWLEDWFYGELCAETRDEKGWQKLSRQRNEAWDLAYYTIGACISPMVNVEKIDWENPPPFARPWDQNSMIIKTAFDEAFAPRSTSSLDLASLGAALG